MVKHIPNTITLGNVLCGCFGLLYAFEDDFLAVGVCILLALVFDFSDGFVARLLKATSPIGKDLDSLADMVTFGVLPGMVMYRFMLFSLCDPNVCTGLISQSYFPFLAFLIPAFSALRLAKFNNDTRQSDQFIGLPTPANAAFVISLPIIVGLHPEFAEIVSHPKVLGVITILSAYLLVAELPLLALKFKNFGVKGNEMRYLLILISVVLVVVFQVVAIPIIIVVYIVLSVIANFF